MIRFVGMGACGSRIALQVEEIAKVYGLDPKVFYINFDRIDMKELSGVDKRRKLLIGSHGTGRTPEVGEQIARDNKKEISEFLRSRLSHKDLTILFFGAGGGTGSGLAPVVADILNKLKYQYGAAITFPDRSSDVEMNRNAIFTLNRVMEFSKTMKPLILADNDYLSDNLKHMDKKGDWWGSVNMYIASAFVSVWSLVNADDDRKSSIKGIGNLDWGEVKRAFHVDGLSDIRVVNIPVAALKQDNYIQTLFKTNALKQSLCGRYPIKDTLTVTGGAILPPGSELLDKCQEMFDVIQELTPNAAIRRWGTIFQGGSTEIGEPQYVKLVMITSGYKLPADINKKIKDIKRDSARYVKTRDKKSKVDLAASGVGMSLGVGEGFKI